MNAQVDTASTPFTLTLTSSVGVIQNPSGFTGLNASAVPGSGSSLAEMILMGAGQHAGALPGGAPAIAQVPGARSTGIERMDMAGALPTGKNTGLDFSASRIADSSGDIMSGAVGYSGSDFKVNFSTQDVGKSFTRFNDLAEAGKPRMTAESGIRRTNYGLQFKTGGGPGGNNRDGLNITQFDSDTGRLQTEAANFDFGGVKFQADIRSVDTGFNRMSALSDAERANMALTVRRMFDPNAQASNVTAQDKAQITGETGLDRSNYRVDYATGAVHTALSISGISSSTGGLNRTAADILGKDFGLHFAHQSIDDGFTRFANLQPMEMASYGNEHGMSRTTLGGSLKLKYGSLSFNDSDVNDGQGNGMGRGNLDFSNSRLKFHTSFMDIAPGFTRIGDLSDADKAGFLNQQGLRRDDLSLNYQASKALSFDALTYSSINSAGQNCARDKFTINYQPKTGPKVTALSDDNTYIDSAGLVSSYSHQNVTFQESLQAMGGLLVKAVSDNNTTQDGTASPVATSVCQAHIESNQAARNSFMVDVLDQDLGNGHFANQRGFGIKDNIDKQLAIHCSLSETDADVNSQDDVALGMDCALSKDLKLNFNLADREGAAGSQQAHVFGLSGILARRFLMLNNVTVNSGINTTSLCGRQTACNNALKIDAGMLRGKFVFDNSDKLNQTNGIYYSSRILEYRFGPKPQEAAAPEARGAASHGSYHRPARQGKQTIPWTRS